MRSSLANCSPFPLFMQEKRGKQNYRYFKPHRKVLRQCQNKTKENNMQCKKNSIVIIKEILIKIHQQKINTIHNPSDQKWKNVFLQRPDVTQVAALAYFKINTRMVNTYSRESRGVLPVIQSRYTQQSIEDRHKRNSLNIHQTELKW